MRDDIPSSRLGRWVIAAYGLPALPLALLTLPVFVYIPPFYAESLGIPLAAVAQALVVIRLADAFSDPLIGYAGDRFPARNRRKVWLTASIPVVAVAAWFLFSPGETADTGHLIGWGVALSLGWTMAIVPLSAWGAELSTDYNERTRIAGTREALVLAGILVATALPALLPLLGQESPRAVLTALAIIVAAGFPLAALVTLAIVPEPQDRSVNRIAALAGLKAMAANRAFLRLVAAFLANGIANAFPASLFLFFVTHRLQAEEATGLLLLTYFLCGLVSVPVWVAIAARTGKHRAWMAGMGIACAVFVWVPLLGPGDITAFLVISALTGLMIGADLALPAAIQADVIDADTAETGEQRSGIYFAAWGMATKLALALGAGLALGLLPGFGFDPGRGIVTESGVTALAVAYSSAPVAFKLLAIALMWRFPLTAERQAELTARISASAAPPASSR